MEKEMYIHAEIRDTKRRKLLKWLCSVIGKLLLTRHAGQQLQ